MLKRDVREMVEYLISERKSFKVTFANGKVEVVEYRGYCWVLGSKGYTDEELVKKMVKFQDNVSKFIIRLEVIEEVEEVEEVKEENSLEVSLVEEVENLTDDLFQDEDLAYCEEAIERETNKNESDEIKMQLKDTVDRDNYCKDCKRSIYGEYKDCDVNIENNGKYVMAADKCYCKIGPDGKMVEKYP